MSDSTGHEADGVGAADPITGVPAAGDDLDRDARLPDLDAEDAAAAADDPEVLGAEADALVTNDAVGGETVDPGPGDGNDGPTGGAPGELTPLEPANDLAGQDIDLDDER